MRQGTFIIFVSYTKICEISNGRNLEKDATIVFTGGSFANSEVVDAAFQSICTARSSAIVKVKASNFENLNFQFRGSTNSFPIGLVKFFLKR